MKRIKITILADVDEEIESLALKNGATQETILKTIKKTFNSSKIESVFVTDFVVDSVEVIE